MPQWELLLGVLALAAAFWRQVRGALTWLRSWVVITHRTDWVTGRLVLSYCDAHYRRSTFMTGGYGSVRTFVRPIERQARVIFQSLISSPQTFWRKWRPLWYTPQQLSSDGQGPEREYAGMSFSFLRGTFDWEQLLLAAADWEDAAYVDDEVQPTRYRIVHHHGTLATFAFGDSDSKPTSGNTLASPPVSFSWDVAGGTRILRWTAEDVRSSPVIASMGHLSLRPELERLVEELKFWRDSEDWYRARGIPWRRGCLLYGGPGTGKTSFLRAVAELLDLPVHVFDLAGMTNQDLRRSWQMMLSTAPCVALFEDIDGVFQGRTNVAAQSSLTGTPVSFDCLLNCMDGIERVDGVLLAVTTNNIDKLDAALADRPGRIDHKVEFLPLDFAGRQKMALRILDDAKLAEQYAKEGAEDSAAQFQERCFRAALKQRFGTRAA